MTKLNDLIRNRRTFHHFINKPVPEKIIDNALSLTIYAPNHRLTYPYRFYRIGEQTKTNLLKSAFITFQQRNESSAESRIQRWNNIPGWIVVTQKTSADEREFHEDFATLSISLYIMMLSLSDQGVASKWSTGSLIFEQEWYDICGINMKEEVIRGLFWYGYPEKEPKPYIKPNYQEFIINKE